MTRPSTLARMRRLVPLRRLQRDTRGISVIEFGLAAPALIGMILFGVDFVMFTNANQEISRLATSTGDLASRYRAAIDEKDVATLFLGGRLAVEGIDFGNNGRLILSSVTRNANSPSNGHWIRWQRCFGVKHYNSVLGSETAGSNGQTSSSIVNVAGMTLNDGDNIMHVEVFYDYKPLFFKNLFGARTIRYNASYMAREIALTGITNNTNIAAASKKTCNLYPAT